MIFFFFSFSLFLFKLSHQKVSKKSFETCREGKDCFTGDPFEIVENLRNSKDEMIKKVMFDVLRDTFSKIELPNEFGDKVKNEDFLKKAIESVVKSQNQNKPKERAESKGKEKIKTTEPIQTSAPSASSASAYNYNYKPYNGQVDIADWHDFYHYFPQLATTVRLWKLEFKESARQNWKKFKGCANPGRLVDWLVPDIEEVKNSKRKTKQKSRRERQRDF